MKTYSVKLKQFGVMTGIALSGIGISGGITPANALTFNFTPAAGTSQLAIDGFNAAGALWSSLFTDNVTVNINIDFTALGAGTLAQAGSTRQSFNYGQVYNALNTDRLSGDDNAAVGSLNNSPTFNMLLNRTSNNPNGSGSATPYLDSNGNANNSTIDMSSANAKALGLDGLGNGASMSVNNLVAQGFGRNGTSIEDTNNANTKGLIVNATGSDAFITFSNQFTWDFNPNNGITPQAYDFIGVAAHEIGHVLGFTSGVDVLDINSPPVNGPFSDGQFPDVNTLDLFRYSAASRNLGVIDWTADTRDKYFSLDRGATNIALFSNGINFGDGRQASHWKDNLGLGIMDPTAAPGERLAIAENDLRAFDVIGWNRLTAVNPNPNPSPVDVPEPSTFIGTFIFAAAGADMVLKRRKQLFDSTEDKKTVEV
jgi:hypothetical protein